MRLYLRRDDDGPGILVRLQGVNDGELHGDAPEELCEPGKPLGKLTHELLDPWTPGVVEWDPDTATVAAPDD